MKKTKLLTSLAALALVVNLGACDQLEVEDESSLGDEGSSDIESSTSDPEVEPTVLNNYTISISLVDEDQNPVAIPFYDTVYINGSWDGWTDWIALTDVGDETQAKLTTTFATLEEGTYEFKGVIGGQDDTPSWSLTEFIISETGGNVSFTVDASDGDGYTNNLTFTVDPDDLPVLSETSMTDDQIADLIIEAAGDIYDSLGWDAFHGYEEEEDELSTEVWFTTDEDGKLYGKAVWYDDGEVDETRYITGGYVYFIDSDNEYNTSSYSQGYDDEFSNYAYGLDTISDVEASSCTITHVEGTTTYTLSYEEDDEIVTIVTQRAGDTFTILSVTDSDDGDVYFAEEISAASVEVLMAGFDPVDWTYEHNSFNELISAVNEGNNYYAESYYYLYQSDEVDYTSEAMASAEVDVVQAFGIFMYATQDAMLQQYIVYQSGSWYYYTVELYVNDYTNGLTAVYGLSGTTIYDLSLWGYYYGTWEDNFSTIGDLADYRSDILIEDAYSTGYYYGDVEEYDVGDNALDALLDCTIGNNDIWDYWFAEGMGWNYYFGYANAASIYYYSEYLSGGIYTYFDPILEVAFDDGGNWYYASSSDHSRVLYQEVVAFTDIYPDETGVTEIPSGYAAYL